jgi:metal-responsive CopG/Arc/MetJ family transcriptional regulator
MTPLRTIIDLPQSQIDALARIAEREGLSRAELIRRAVASYLKGRGDDGESAFGLWGPPQTDGLDYQNRVRGEWDR